MSRVHTVVDSPLGLLTLVATGGVLSGLFMDCDNRHRPDPADLGSWDAGVFGGVVEQLEAYFRGELRVFDVPLALEGTEFQRRVWRELSRIPFGETVTYARLAALVGRPVSAARAVGTANGSNPVSIIVPCHRVVGSDGGLTGYAWGVERKRWLLDLESGTPALF